MSNFRTLADLVSKKWFQVLIILGLFIALVQPKVNLSVKSNEQTQQKQKVNWFADIPITEEARSVQAIQQASTQKDDKVISTIKPIESFNNDNTTELLKNKKMIVSECIRIEKDLSEWSKLNYERKNIPTIEYLLNALEQEVGKEYLYSDIQRGVQLVMKKLGR